MTSMLPTLYTHVEETEIFEGPSIVVTGSEKLWLSPVVDIKEDEVGMLAMDFAVQAAVTSAGEITRAEIGLVTHNADSNSTRKRKIVRGSRTWTRVFLPVDSGKRKIGIATNEYFKSTDNARVRRIFYHRYVPSSYVYAIDQLTPPKPLSGLQVMNTLEGSVRTQRTGNTGSEIAMTLCFLTGESFNKFMDTRHDSYMILKSRYGLFGGYLNGLDSEPTALGTSVFLRVKMISDQRAGAGSNGI